MDNQELLKRINKRKFPKWMSAVGILIIALIIAAIIFLFLGRDKTNQETNNSDVEIDTSLVGEGEEDPENQEIIDEDGVEINAEELIVGDERINAIDVSKWQGKINWNQVKESGIEAAFIRIGYRAENGTIYKDDTADYNIQQADKAGILVGVYFFSTATSTEEALEEANWTKAAIKGYSISYPVVYDCEGFKNASSRMYTLTKEERTSHALTYMEAMKDAGYDVMFYGALNEIKDSHACKFVVKYWKWFVGGLILVVILAGIAIMLMMPSGEDHTVAEATVQVVSNEPAYQQPVRERFGVENRESGEIILQSIQESWVKVEDARGKTVFSRVLVPGDVYYVPAGGKNKATFGNAGGVDVWVRGELAPKVGDINTRKTGITLDADVLLGTTKAE
jgi:hypothetical protein